ncbi:MAG: iron-containing alcohol dehydrogenase [Deltaproteobacteria bacterium]|nr:iron-containing alcohol dehydrogenase [Deltaproteobacteria bacterium]
MLAAHASILSRQRPDPAEVTPPRLQHSRRGLKAILGQLVDERTLIVTDDYNFKAAKALGKGHVHLVQSDRLAPLTRVLAEVEFDNVVAVGGCTALDAGRALAGESKKLVMVPLLSTACISANKAILRDDRKIVKTYTRAPDATVVSYPYLMDGSPETRARWAQSGFGDLFANLGAALDLAYEQQRYSLRGVREKAAPTLTALSWVNTRFTSYDERALRHLAEYVHESNVRVMTSNEPRLAGGGEHHVYYYLKRRFGTRYSKGGATHGQIVAAGTLIAAKIFADETGDRRLYESLRAAYTKLGLPVDRPALEASGIRHADLLVALQAVSKSHPTTVLGHHFAKGDFSVVDAVFTPEVQPVRSKRQVVARTRHPRSLPPMEAGHRSGKKGDRTPQTEAQLDQLERVLARYRRGGVAVRTFMGVISSALGGGGVIGNGLVDDPMR